MIQINGKFYASPRDYVIQECDMEPKDMTLEEMNQMLSNLTPDAKERFIAATTIEGKNNGTV